jgi:hypothetical protein
VIVMRLRGDEQVSSIALVAESEAASENGDTPLVEPEAAPGAETDKNE